MFRLYPSHYQAVQQRKRQYTTCIKLTYGKMKCELHFSQFHIYDTLKCLCLYVFRRWLKVAVYLDILHFRAIDMQYLCLLARNCAK